MLRSLASAASRRDVLTGLASGALATLPLGPDGQDAAAKKKKTCPSCKKRQKGKCKQTLPDGTTCPGGKCQGGACLPSSAEPTCTPNCSDRTCGNDGCGS